MSDQTMESTDNPAEGDTPEYVQQMVDRAEGKTPAADKGEDGETLLAGKYKSVEDLEKGYQELQKMLGSRSTEETAESEETTSEDDSTEETDADSADLPERKAEEAESDTGEIDFEKYTKSIVENGALTDDDYKELEGQGYSRAMVDTYVAGLKSLQTSRAQAAVEAVGSQEEFQKVREWASGLPEAEYNAVQKAITGAQSAEEVAVVYGMLAARYRKANPGEPELVTGSGGPPASATGFASRTQMSEAINDPRYETDPAYRKDVEAKIAKSNFL